MSEGDLDLLMKKQNYGRTEVYLNQKLFPDGTILNKSVIIDVGGTEIDMPVMCLGKFISQLIEIQDKAHETHHTKNEVPYSLKWLMREKARCVYIERYEDIKALDELISLVRSNNRKK
jgi:hypothetical protein